MTTAEMLEIDGADLQTRQMAVPVHILDAENSWGLRHMSGNALEVTITPFEQQHIGLTTSSAYLEYALRATEGFFVLKGGSFDGALDSVRLATRKRTELSWAFEDMGFRVLRQLE